MDKIKCQLPYMIINNSTNNAKNNNKNINTNNNKKFNISILSFIFYVSNEIANNKVIFNPWNFFIINELSQYSNIVCILNNKTNINLNGISAKSLKSNWLKMWLKR